MPEALAGFQKTQFQLSRHLRDPENCAAPAGIEDRRMKIYRDLIFNNIESFISSGFPVIRSLYKEHQWHQLIRDFISEYRCETPYFLELSQEFLHYLQQRFLEPPADKPFLLELAHYEWVELALSVSTEPTPPEPHAVEDILVERLAVSPLAWRLCYQYPVHRIGPQNQPQEPAPEPSYLVVYRDHGETVRFLETNAVTTRLLQLMEESYYQTGEQVIRDIAEELGQLPDNLLQFGKELLENLYQSGILQIKRAG